VRHAGGTRRGVARFRLCRSETPRARTMRLAGAGAVGPRRPWQWFAIRLVVGVALVAGVVAAGGLAAAALLPALLALPSP
jgi:hypothetical protein